MLSRNPDIITALFFPLLALAGLIGYVIVLKKQDKPVMTPYVIALTVGLLIVSFAIIYGMYFLGR